MKITKRGYARMYSQWKCRVARGSEMTWMEFKIARYKAIKKHIRAWYAKKRLTHGTTCVKVTP